MTGQTDLQHPPPVTAEPAPPERRLRETAQWVTFLCRQLSDAIGWSVRFVPSSDAPAPRAGRTGSAPSSVAFEDALRPPSASSDIPHPDDEASMRRRREILAALQVCFDTAAQSADPPDDMAASDPRLRPAASNAAQTDGGAVSTRDIALCSDDASADRDTSRRPPPSPLRRHVLEDLLKHHPQPSAAVRWNAPERNRDAGAAPSPVTEIPISNGRHEVGRIVVSPPAGGDACPDAVSVLAVTSIVARLVSQNLGLQRLLQLRTEEFSNLLELAQQPSATGPTADAVRRVLRGVLELTGFRVAGLFLLDPELAELRLRESCAKDGQQWPHAVRAVADASMDARALRTGTVTCQRPIESDEDRWLPDGVRTAICQRIDCSAGPLGTLWVGDRRLRCVSEHDRRLLATFASLLGQTLEGAVLQHESSSQRRFRREIAEIVGGSDRRRREIRHRLAGLDIAARNESHFELGGDICEIVRLGKHKVAIAIGDACGDGLPAAVVATAIRGALWTFWGNPRLADAEDVSLLVECVNRAVYRISQPHQFASLLYAVIDTRKHRLTYCNAGHPPALLLRRGHTTRLSAQGLIIGVAPETRYACGLLTFQPGDVLALYTDGIIEAQKRHGVFGSQRLEAAIRQHDQQRPSRIVDAVWAALAGFTGTQRANDDRTVAVVKFVGS